MIFPVLHCSRRRPATASKDSGPQGEPLLALPDPVAEGRYIRWFKHISKSSDDPVLLDIEEKFGIAGYARFFKMIEAISESMKKDSPPSLSLSVNRWCQILRAKKKILRTFLEHCENVYRIKQELNGNILTITYPNVLKYKDEYQQKSRHTRDTLTPQIQSREEEGEIPLSSLPKKQVAQTSPSLVFPEEEKPKPTRFKPPTEDELTTYMAEQEIPNPSSCAQAFIAYYETRGWIPNGQRTQMKSWKSAVRTWKIRNHGGNGNGSKRELDAEDIEALADIERHNREYRTHS